MIIIDIGNGFSLKIVDPSGTSYRDLHHEFICHIDIYQNNKKLQTLLRFDNRTTGYSLYRWRNEGRLPPSVISLFPDGKDYRLGIVGVDEI
jgi:hypothetical protein